MKKILSVIALSTTFGLLGGYLYNTFSGKAVFTYASPRNDVSQPSSVSYNGRSLEGTDFIKASQAVTPCVVFIKCVSTAAPRQEDFFFWDFFGNRGPVSSSGSGVIISKDGYIVTNNHVVKDADKIDVILNNNKRTYTAKVVGTDANSDLALLKIDAKDLSSIVLGNSDNLKTGEWVLAVGNPFNLTSTVTAGIVSAKGRNINANRNSQFALESFIQTDAAINPGNSGGALVNTNGELVGINTAIQSQTGSYIGYGFAIPSNIVAKIVKDIVDYGEVQKGYTGMNVIDIDGETANKLNVNNGVMVTEVYEDGPAYKAGLKSDDVIIEVNGKTIESKGNYDEQLSYHRPGEHVKMIVDRKGKLLNLDLLLINREGNISITKKNSITSQSLGADFELISKFEKDKLGIKSGVKITNIHNGRIRNMGIPEGFIIYKLNNAEFTDPNDLIKQLENARGRIVIEGFYENGGKATYSFYSY